MAEISMIALLAALTLSQTAPSTADARAEFERLVGGGFRITLAGLEADERVSQEALGPLATQLCAGRVPVFGKFTQDRQVAPGRDGKFKPARFVQEITCTGSATASALAPASPVASTFKPSPVDEAAVRAVATAFIDRYVTGKGPAAWQLLSAGMQADNPLPDWAAQAVAREKSIGASAAISIAKLSWYNDPPGVAAGSYVAADFVGSSKTQAALCGFVAMYRDSDGRWSVVRVESGSLPRAVDVTLDPERRAALRREIRCVDG